jgi:hypothetical protein
MASAGTGGNIVTAGQQIGTSEATPKAFVDALGAHAIIVLFYQPNAAIDTAVLKEVQAAGKSVKGAVTIVYKAADNDLYGDLAEQLGLYRAPSIAIVNRTGEMENHWTGYADRELLASVLSNAQKAPAAKVTPKDAPADTDAISEAATTAAKTGSDTFTVQ